ncbi:MAG: tRNA 4-thiouridine(8) synthase ThiI [Candidatus Omnitrophica bacterium]|nr:tRNA 4-thiouridine(8) synthase ThiI [Candidatus Omnitrophota bacterium]
MKAVVIISGGLDSSLAVKAILNQGIDVVALHFLIPFVMDDEVSAFQTAASRIAENLGVTFRLEILSDKYLDIIKNPSYGYGKNLNPCIDCKILMLKKAREVMNKEGASFIATGEVLGQRPMSQNKRALSAITRDSGLDGLLVRPLSAKLLPLTIPQEKGWLKDEFLFNFEGRGRNRQLALAKEWQIKEFPWPGGGCLLTDKIFCRRLKDLIKHEKINDKEIKLIKIGRYFRVNDGFSLTVGRNQEENKKLTAIFSNGDYLFQPLGLPGPTAIGRGRIDEEAKNISSGIIAWYTDKKKEVKVKFQGGLRGNIQVLKARALDEGDLQAKRI